MLGQLVESSRRRVRRRLSTAVSVAAHAMVVSAAVAVARPVPEEPSGDRVITWHPPPPAPPVDCEHCPSRSRAGPDHRIDRIELVIPDVTVPGPLLDVPVEPAAWPQPRGIPLGKEFKRWLPGREDDTSSTFERTAVDREVTPLPTNPAPRYPEALRAAGIAGSVQARFVVDTTGRVLMHSVIVDRADHQLFADAVIQVLRRHRFTPAELRGRKVQQLVVQPFVFVIRE
jgi:periplasmic protein TonB